MDKERRDALTEEAIKKAVLETLNCLNGEKDIIAERAIKKALENMDFHECPIKFRSQDDIKKFNEAIPSLISLDDGIKTAKKRTKWIGLLFATYLLQNIFDDVVAFFKAVVELLKNMK